MRKFLIVFFILMISAQFVSADTNIHVTGKIILKKNKRLYIDKGRTDGVKVGQKFDIIYDNQYYGSGIIAWTGEDISYSRVDSLVFYRLLYYEPLEVKILLEYPLKSQGGVIHMPFYRSLNLKPSEIKTPIEKTVACLIYDGLVKLDNQGQIIPALANSWEVHGNTYTFYLDHTVRFHSGKPIDASDVAYSLVELAKAPDVTPASSFVLEIYGYEDVHFGGKNELKGIFIPNKYTIAITTKDTFVPFLKYLAGPGGYIIPAVDRTKTLPTPIGTGPFKIASAREDVITLVANEEYFGTPPTLDSLVLIRYKDRKEVALDFELGKIDLFFFDSATERDYLSNGNYTARKYYTSSTVMLGFQCQRQYQKDFKLSRALQYLFDKESIVRVLLGNAAQKATGLIPQTIGEGSSNITNYYFSVKEAKEKISRIDGIPSELNLFFDDTDPMLEPVAGYIAGQLRQVGIKTITKNTSKYQLDRQSALSLLDLYLFRYDVPIGDLDAFFYPLFSKRLNGQTNFFYYENPQLEKLIDGARRLDDEYTRNDIYRKAENLIMEKPPLVVLYYPIMTVISRRDLYGFEADLSAFINLRQAYYQAGR